MPDSLDRGSLLVLYTYNSYANKLLLDGVEKLTYDEYIRECCPSHGSVRNLLCHMLECEAYFLAVCQDRPYEEVEHTSLISLRNHWSQLGARQVEFIGSLSQDDLLRNVPIKLVKGHEYELPTWQLLTQAAVHSIHHRGELSIVLTNLGHPLPTLDITLQFMEQSGQPWPS